MQLLQYSQKIKIGIPFLSGGSLEKTLIIEFNFERSFFFLPAAP